MKNYIEEEAYLRAKKRLDKIKGFYHHLAWYVIINIFIISMIYINAENASDFWNIGTFMTAIGWGIGLTAHAFGVFGMSFIFGKNWEQRKMEKFIKEDQEESQKWN